MSSRARLLRHPLAIAGVILTTVSAVVFAALLVAMLSGAFFNNPYAGLVVFIVVPALLVLGLLLIAQGVARAPLAAAPWPCGTRLGRLRFRATGHALSGRC